MNHKPKIGYYISHHGSGHINRAKSLLPKLLEQADITVLSNKIDNFNEFKDLNKVYTSINSIKAGNEFLQQHRPCSALHGSELKGKESLSRMSTIVKWINETKPDLMLIDVCAEVNMLARLCGIPTILFKQHGKRVDLAHKCSYENAIALIAPYSKELEDRYTTSETKAKTLYTGMFSRFDNLAKSDLTENLYKSVKKKDILVLSGSGSDDLDLDYLFYTARLNFEYNWHIVGSKKNYTNTATNFNNYGVVDNIAEHLNSADLIVSSAGHNLVSEIASFRKPMLLIPAVRPFDEQKIKAKILKKFNLALYSEKFPKAAAWSKIFKQASELELNKWSKHFNADAISQATNFIIDLAYKCQVVDGEEVKVDYQEYLKIINS